MLDAIAKVARLWKTGCAHFLRPTTRSRSRQNSVREKSGGGNPAVCPYRYRHRHKSPKTGADAVVAAEPRTDAPNSPRHDCRPSRNEAGVRLGRPNYRRTLHPKRFHRGCQISGHRIRCVAPVRSKRQGWRTSLRAGPGRRRRCAFSSSVCCLIAGKPQRRENDSVAVQCKGHQGIRKDFPPAPLGFPPFTGEVYSIHPGAVKLAKPHGR